jgi:hypothetical protein
MCGSKEHGYGREFEFSCERAQDGCPGIFSAVPGGTVHGSHGDPGLTSWAILNRPLRQAQGRLFGTDRDSP